MNVPHVAHPTCMCPYRRENMYCHPECIVLLMTPRIKLISVDSTSGNTPSDRAKDRQREMD